MVWSCALAHCPVVGGHWLQSSAVHRVWNGVAKWSDSFPFLSQDLFYPVQISHFSPHQSSPRPSRCLHHAWQMASSTPPASSHLVRVSQMVFFVIWTPQTQISLSITLFFVSNLPLSSVCVLLPIFIFFFLLASLRYSFFFFCNPAYEPASRSGLFSVDVEAGVVRALLNEAACRGPVRHLFLKLDTLMYLSSGSVVHRGLPLLFLVWLEPVCAALWRELYTALFRDFQFLGNYSHGKASFSQNKNRLTSSRRTLFVSGHFESVIKPTVADASDAQLV